MRRLFLPALRATFVSSWLLDVIGGATCTFKAPFASCLKICLNSLQVQYLTVSQ